MSRVDEGERRARMLLSQVAEPGDPDACRLVRDHSAADLLSRLRRGGIESGKVAGWSQRVSRADGDAIGAAAAAVGARFVCPGDDEWPLGLDDLAQLEGESGERRGGAPFGLWLRGNGSLASLSRRCVAVVGSRAATAYGEHVATTIAFDAAGQGFTTVSGGAYGIDAAVHRATLAGQSATIAILAGGIDRLYPAGNIRMLEHVTERGLLVSEAAPGSTPTKSRFLVRNRLIAALSQGTLVVEAALRSGALNTARWAMDLGRAVMGVPGPVTSMA
jgi:DNA processing protein